MPSTHAHNTPNRRPAPVQRALAALVWLLASVCVGLACGGGAVLLSEVCELAQDANAAFSPLAYALPACALAAYGLYRALGVDNALTTATVFAHARTGEPLSPKLAPAILMGTALSLLGSGSVGKEAAALQLGGSLAAQVGRLGNTCAQKGRSTTLTRTLDDIAQARGTFILAGMAAAFSALLFAPVAATLLVLEVAKLSRAELLRWRTLCIPVASVVAWALAELFGVGRLWEAWAGHAQAAPAVIGDGIGPLIALCAACLAVGVCFVWLLKSLRACTSRRFSRTWLRMLVGAVLACALAALVGRAYCGTGSLQIEEALSGAGVDTWAFALKALLTLCCLGLGLKGGEVMPALCIGACLGYSIGDACGCDPAAFAALGMVGVFSVCSLSPLASLALGLEAFGAALGPCVAVAALLPGAVAILLDALRLCRTSRDLHRYLRDPHGLAAQQDRFSLGLFA